jgi:hypothetical protein
VSAWEAAGATDEWYTPRYVFDALGCRFDMDVAAPAAGPRHVPAARWLSSDGLNAPWVGFVWVNPPYGGRNTKEPRLRKLLTHGDGVALVPDRTSAPWFQRQAPQFDAMLFTDGKIKFERPDGSTGNSPGNGSALLAVGPRGVQALLRASQRGLGFLAVPRQREIVDLFS